MRVGGLGEGVKKGLGWREKRVEKNNAALV